MIQDKVNLMHYTADEGKYIVPKNREGTDYIYTTDIWIGSVDSIDNYEEIDIEIVENEKQSANIITE